MTKIPGGRENGSQSSRLFLRQTAVLSAFNHFNVRDLVVLVQIHIHQLRLIISCKEFIDDGAGARHQTRGAFRSAEDLAGLGSALAVVDMINLGLRDHMVICGGEACLYCQSQAEGRDLVCLICTMRQTCLFSACACPPGIRLPPVSDSHRSLGQHIAQAGRESIPRGHGRSENRGTAPESYCGRPRVRALSAGASRGVLTIEGPKKIG